MRAFLSSCVYLVMTAFISTDNYDKQIITYSIDYFTTP